MKITIQNLDFHQFHRYQTSYQQHWLANGTDLMIGYRYIEKGNENKHVVVFIPSSVHPEDKKRLEIFNKILENEK